MSQKCQNDVSFIQDGGRKWIYLSAGTQKYAKKKRIHHAFVDRKDNSVPRVTVLHHLAEPGVAKQ